MHIHHRKAFTLIELLTVIAIIAILVGLLFPAIKTALLNAERTRAQTTVASLATAVKAYYTEYGRYPITDATAGQDYTTTTNFVALLQGANLTSAATPSGTLAGNPRTISFLEIKNSDRNSAGDLVDPWKKPYYISMDVIYTNNITGPYGAVVNAGVLVWSLGPDGQQTLGSPKSNALNKDNIESW